MSTSKYPAIIFLIVVIAALSLPAFYYPHLPEKVAVHFNINGEADSWTSKTNLVVIQLLTVFFLSVFLGLIAVFAGKIPKSLINIPNKNYWLSDERQLETINLIKRFMYWLGSITIGFITVTFQETLRANALGSKPGLDFWIYFGGYIILTTVFTIKFVLHFSKKNIPDSIRLPGNFEE